jgi:heptosyltransferase-2
VTESVAPSPTGTYSAATAARGSVGERVLFVKLAALGDVAMATAFAEAMKARDPRAHVTWLCGRGVADLVRLVPTVDEVLAVDDRAILGGSAAARVRAVLGAWRLLLGRRFDRVVIAHGDARYDLLTWTARGRRRLFRGPRRGRRVPVRMRWFPDEYARLAADEPDAGPRVRTTGLADLRRVVPNADAALPALAGRPYAVLVPGGARNALRSTPQRRWPVDRYAAVARDLAHDGLAVVLLGDAHDRYVLGAFDDAPALVDALGVLPLASSLGVLASAAVVVTHDTGPLHLARLVRAPVVALFGPTSPLEFALADERTTVLWGGARLACRPCYDGSEVAPCANNLCMQDVTVDEVVRAARALVVRVPAARALA